MLKITPTVATRVSQAESPVTLTIHAPLHLLTWRRYLTGQRDGVADGKFERFRPGDEEGLRFVQYLAGCFTW